MKVLIIEDERAAARNLRSLLEQIDPQIQIQAVLDSVVDSLEWLAANPAPELVFMDIHLADGSAFDIFDRCSLTCPVVFTTAYDEYAIKAFKVNSIDYLLKPISATDLSDALDKYTLLHSSKPKSEDPKLEQLLATIRRSQSTTTHLLLPKGGNKLVPLPLVQVTCFFIADGVVWARTLDQRQLATPHTLDQLTEMVDPGRFFRANRQFLISKDEIADIELWFGSRLALHLKSLPDERVIINKPRVSEFKAWFSGL